MIGTAAEGERGDFLEVAQLDDCEVCYCREIEERGGAREGSVLSDSTDGYCTTSLGEEKVRFAFAPNSLGGQFFKVIRHRRPKYKHTMANLSSNRTQGEKVTAPTDKGFKRLRT